MPRDVMLYQRVGVEPAKGPGPRPLPRPVGAAAPSRRGPQSWCGTLTPCLAVEKAENVEVGSEFARVWINALRPALGPNGTGNRWSLAGTSGHGQRVGIAGN